MPQAFYDSPAYQPLRDRVVTRQAPPASVSYSRRNEAMRSKLLAEFATVETERLGILRGEYVLLRDGLALIDRDGRAFITNTPLSHAVAYEQDLAKTYSDAAWAAGDAIPSLRCLPIVSSPYGSNYYHFSLEVAPRLRHFAGMLGIAAIVPAEALSRTFQRDLLARCAGGTTIAPLQQEVRITDPVLIEDNASEEALLWLRQASGLAAAPGKRRVYVRRGRHGTRSRHGGGISESPAFLKMLGDFGFETVEFGGGSQGIAQQVALLDGAGVILAAHGAALTNLAYVHASTTVIEVMGYDAPRTCFMQVAATIGLHYHGMFGETVDAQNDIVPDEDDLREALRAAL